MAGFKNSLMLCVLLLAAFILAGCQVSTPVLRDRAEASLAAGNYPAAEADVTELLSREQSSWMNQYLLGRLRMKQARYQDAQVALGRAWAIYVDGEKRDEMLDLLAEAYYQQGPQAYDNLASFLAQQAEQYADMPSYLRQARYLRMTGDVDNTLLALRKAEQLATPESPELFLELARFYKGLGDRANAVQALRHALHYMPENDEVRQMLRSYNIVPGPTIAMPVR
jgi:tetratricopeptide (TPR) repeat protein